MSFELSPIHGDSDIFVSRNSSFPNKTSFEKMSQRIGGQEEAVSFNNADVGELAQTYYVGIYGYSYSSYSLLVSVNRYN